jgi:hypothetical protein
MTKAAREAAKSSLAHGHPHRLIRFFGVGDSQQSRGAAFDVGQGALLACLEQCSAGIKRSHDFGCLLL